MASRDRFVERGALSIILGFEHLISFLGTGLVSNLLYRCLEFGTGQRKEKGEKKSKFQTKPINGQNFQTFISFDFLRFWQHFPCIRSLFVCVTAGMVPLSLGWRGVTPLLPIYAMIRGDPYSGGGRDGEG